MTTDPIVTITNANPSLSVELAGSTCTLVKDPGNPSDTPFSLSIVFTSSDDGPDVEVVLSPSDIIALQALLTTAIGTYSL